MALGKQVKQYRLFHKWTLDDLSTRSGVDVGTISALEVRDSKRSEKAPALARAFGLSVEQLLDESTDWSSVSAAKVISGDLGHLIDGDYPPAPVEDTDKHAVHDISAEKYPRRNPYWPFTVSQASFQRLLSAEDISNIDAFIQGVVKTRDSDARKSRRTTV